MNFIHSKFVICPNRLILIRCRTPGRRRMCLHNGMLNCFGAIVHTFIATQYTLHSKMEDAARLPLGIYHVSSNFRLIDEKLKEKSLLINTYFNNNTVIYYFELVCVCVGVTVPTFVCVPCVRYGQNKCKTNNCGQTEMPMQTATLVYARDTLKPNPEL